ncbi:MAG: nucleoside-diphosphate kinase [Phycisphaerae bacterium]|nr:nucleoside-diphosphate kinase [Phycisphaerae bacterium]
MSEELAYVIVTPYSLHKSRTGGILSRLITRTGLDLAAARMFGPSSELVDRYADKTISDQEPQDKRIQGLIYQYIRTHLAPDPKTGRRQRVMMLVFKGEDAVRKTRAVVGSFRPGRHGGETIRDTYGDLILDSDGEVRYFEPAVLAAPTPAEAQEKLKLWARYSDTDGGVLENVIDYGQGEVPQRTLVLIKPDNFRFPTGRPGNMIDFFSKTGLFIVGIRIVRMSCAQALEFYGVVREVLRTKLKRVVGSKAKDALETALEISIPEEQERQLGEMLGPLFGDSQFASIIRFMSGRTPSECPASEINRPGTEKCIALVYEGVDAVKKIRDVLGPTDPSKAPVGSIRREFGESVMVNAAHASDSEENARREMGIIRVGEDSFRRVVEEFYGGLG